MTRYRDHRGGLAESMATQRTFADRAELVAYVASSLAPWGFAVTDEDLRVEHYCDGDDRIGWADCFIVIWPGFGVVGLLEHAL